MYKAMLRKGTKRTLEEVGDDDKLFVIKHSKQKISEEPTLVSEDFVVYLSTMNGHIQQTSIGHDRRVRDLRMVTASLFPDLSVQASVKLVASSGELCDDSAVLASVIDDNCVVQVIFVSFASMEDWGKSVVTDGGDTLSNIEGEFEVEHYEKLLPNYGSISSIVPHPCQSSTYFTLENEKGMDKNYFSINYKRAVKYSIVDGELLPERFLFGFANCKSETHEAICAKLHTFVVVKDVTPVEARYTPSTIYQHQQYSVHTRIELFNIDSASSDDYFFLKAITYESTCMYREWTQCDLTPDGKILVVGSSFNEGTTEIRVFDTDTGLEKFKVTNLSQIAKASFCVANYSLAIVSPSRELAMYDLPTGTLLFTYNLCLDIGRKNNFDYISMNSSATELSVVAVEEGKIYHWDVLSSTMALKKVTVQQVEIDVGCPFHELPDTNFIIAAPFSSETLVGMKTTIIRSSGVNEKVAEFPPQGTLLHGGGYHLVMSADLRTVSYVGVEIEQFPNCERRYHCYFCVDILVL